MFFRQLRVTDRAVQGCVQCVWCGGKSRGDSSVYPAVVPAASREQKAQHLGVCGSLSRGRPEGDSAACTLCCGTVTAVEAISPRAAAAPLLWSASSWTGALIAAATYWGRGRARQQGQGCLGRKAVASAVLPEERQRSSACRCRSCCRAAPSLQVASSAGISLSFSFLILSRCPAAMPSEAAARTLFLDCGGRASLRWSYPSLFYLRVSYNRPLLGGCASAE